MRSQTWIQLLNLHNTNKEEEMNMSKWIDCEVDNGKINSRCPKCNSPVRLSYSEEDISRHDCKATKKSRKQVTDIVTKACREFKKETRSE